MAINLDFDMTASFNAAITPQEMQSILQNAKNCSTQAGKRNIIADNACFEDKLSENPVIMAGIRLRGNIASEKAVVHIIKLVKPVKRLRSKPKRNDRAELNRARDNAVRKYTKEMQNRDAIIKKSKAMRKKAKSTKSAYDDKFAEAAAAPTKRFDKIIYGSVTTDEAEKLLDTAFSDVIESVK